MRTELNPGLDPGGNGHRTMPVTLPVVQSDGSGRPTRFSEDGFVSPEEELEGLRALVKNLNKQPLAYATVMYVKESGQSAQLPNFLRQIGQPEEYTRGVRVMVRPDLEDTAVAADYQKGIGTITRVASPTSPDADYAQVQFPDGGTTCYRYRDSARGPVEIYLVDRVLSEQEDDRFVVLIFDNKYIEVKYPNFEVVPGQLVKIEPNSKQILGPGPILKNGLTSRIRKVNDDGTCEVEADGAVRIAYVGSCANLQKGDRIIVDTSFSIILANLGKDDDCYKLNGQVNVSWDDIGGLEDAKSDIMQAILLPLQKPEIFARYKQKPVKGILLYGEPRCGKTLIVKALATSVAEIYQKEQFASGFIYVKGPEMLDKFVGETEAKIRQLFARAREHKEKYGYPAIIFIDEAEAILNRRGSGVSSDVDRTIVPMFLTEMDGMEDSGAIVILATNRRDMLDPALAEGRIDIQIHVGRPDQEAAKQIFAIHLGDRPLAEGVEKEALATKAAEEFYSQERVLYTVTSKPENGETKQTLFTLGQVATGAMLAQVVAIAANNAMARDIEENTESGISEEDMIDAINQKYEENLSVMHKDELSELVENLEGRLIGVEKQKQANA